MTLIRLFKVTFFFIIITIFSVSLCYAENIVNGKFSPYLEFTNGDSPNQLLWMIEANGTPIMGPLQGPMAFVTMPNQNLWVADTQNARFCLFSKEGKNLKEIDLLKLGKSAGLPNPPAIVDFCFSNGKLIAADATSNSLIEINPKNNEFRVFKSNMTEKGNWFQISFVYSDSNNRIYIDDIVSGKIIILDKDGKYISENVAACIGVSKNDSSMASIRYIEKLKGESKVGVYQLLTNNGYSINWKVANEIIDDSQIKNIRIIGVDNKNLIYVLYETKDFRFYKLYSHYGQLIKTIRTQKINAVYNPGRPDWIDSSGNIYSVTISDKKLKILKLITEK